MLKKQLPFLMLWMLVMACKTTQPVITNPKDKDMNGGGTDKSDTTIKSMGVDSDISKFRITYDLDNAYEEFGAPKIIKKVDNSSNEPKSKNITSKEHVNDALEKKLNQIRYLNGDIDKTMGYRILIYSGHDIDKAREYHSELKVVLSGTAHASELDYNPPNYTVKTGKFISKFNAHELYTELKKDFPRAIVVKEEISFKRSKYIID
ncbi:MAG: hypothetical protein ACPGJS_14220 [Flammeovirgaceae bacterium]